MTVPPRQKALLAALALLVGIVAWQRLAPAGGGGAGSRGSRTRAGAALDSHVAELRVADLEPRAATHETGRDPFHFGAPPPPPGPTPEELEAARQRALAEAEARARALAAQRAATPPAPPAPQPPAVTLRYLGSFGSASRRVAVFADGKSIYNALEGDVLDGKFIVHHIGLESVDLRFVDFPEAPAKRLAAGG